MNDDLPSFEQFSDEIDEEMRAFAQYMMTRAVAGGPLSAKRYIIILASLSRGISMLEYMLEQEGISKSDIELALMAMKATDQEIREGLDQLKREQRYQLEPQNRHWEKPYGTEEQARERLARWAEKRMKQEKDQSKT